MSQSLISDQNLKVDMLIGNSISNHKFHFIYCFSCENGKSLALIMLWNLSVSSCLFHRVFENPLRYLPPLYVDRLKVTKKQLVVSVLWWCGKQRKSHTNFFHFKTKWAYTTNFSTFTFKISVCVAGSPIFPFNNPHVHA